LRHSSASVDSSDFVHRVAEHRHLHRWLAAVAALLGALALAAGEPHPGGREVSFVTAIDVARWIRDGRAEVRIVDLRADSLFDAYHVPGAERMSAAELRTQIRPADGRMVVYASDDADAARAASIARHAGAKEVHVLRGGLVAWIDQIMEPRLEALAATASTAEQAARRERLELSRYLGGMPVVGPPAAGGRQQIGGPAATEAAAVARVMRRGC
jgi:rhodanese-related sulfurtransferase